MVFFWSYVSFFWASQVTLVVKNSPANTGDIRDVSLFLGSGRSPEGGHDKPLQYSCLENSIDRGAWWATGHGVAQSQTWLKWLKTHAYAQLLQVKLAWEILQIKHWVWLTSAWKCIQNPTKRLSLSMSSNHSVDESNGQNVTGCWPRS